MRVVELIAYLAKGVGFDRGGCFRVLGDDQIEYVGPAGLLTDELRAEIREKKKAIVAWLRTPAGALPDEDRRLLDADPSAHRAGAVPTARAWRPGHALLRFVDRLASLRVRPVMAMDGDRETVCLEAQTGTPEDALPALVLEEAFGRADDLERLCRLRGWWWPEKHRPPERVPALAQEPNPDPIPDDRTWRLRVRAVDEILREAARATAAPALAPSPPTGKSDKLQEPGSPKAAPVPTARQAGLFATGDAP